MPNTGYTYLFLMTHIISARTKHISKEVFEIEFFNIFRLVKKVSVHM